MLTRLLLCCDFVFFFSSRRRHTRWTGDWSSDVCSSDLDQPPGQPASRRDQHGARQWLQSACQGAFDIARVHRRRSEERRVGKSVDLGGRRIIKKKKRKKVIIRKAEDNLEQATQERMHNV